MTSAHPGLPPDCVPASSLWRPVGAGTLDRLTNTLLTASVSQKWSSIEVRRAPAGRETGAKKAHCDPEHDKAPASPWAV